MDCNEAIKMHAPLNVPVRKRLLTGYPHEIGKGSGLFVQRLPASPPCQQDRQSDEPDTDNDQN